LTLASGLHGPAGTFTTTRHIEAFTDLVKLIFCIQYAVHLVNTLIFAAASPLENRDVANCVLAARSGVVCCQLFFHQTLQPLGFVGIDNLINFFRMSASEILDLYLSGVQTLSKSTLSLKTAFFCDVSESVQPEFRTFDSFG
jgi:hypothetical protein